MIKLYTALHARASKIFKYSDPKFSNNSDAVFITGDTIWMKSLCL